MSIEENIARVRANIAAAAREAGREASEVTLVGASKMNDAEACRAAIAAGIDALGENREQEMTKKLAEHAYDGAPLHFIGHLQRNKVKNVVGKVALLESVGSLELLAAVSKQAEKLQIVQDILLEVNIGGEESKTGAAPELLWPLLDTAAAQQHIRVKGLMAIPPVNDDDAQNRRYLAQVYQLFVRAGERGYRNVEMQTLSMGMSGDFENAIREGATLVRIGTAIYGERDYSKK